MSQDKPVAFSTKVLKYIEKHPYCDIEDIASDFGHRKLLVSNALAKLETKGLIEFVDLPVQTMQPTHGSHNPVMGWHVIKNKEIEK